ncbi:PAS domain-containing protein [Peribacillus sp. SCS-26]|uniref:STAS domain-containing protein n=1 Tax=Paraperibacillus marinus TaxID=3115295 RepID=UPI0039058593
MLSHQHSSAYQNLALLHSALDASQTGIVITDPDLPDNPIINVNKGFCRITGFDFEDVVGKNCRFLQGPMTKDSDIELIRNALKDFESVSVNLLNYRKNGEIFYNQLTIDPVYNESEQKYYFVGVQKDITKEVTYQDELRAALEEIEELSTPIVPIEDGISVIPLIGTLSDRRVDILFSTLSDHHSINRDQYLLLDLSGIAASNSRFGHHIGSIHKWLSLLGTELVLSGISPEAAISMVKHTEDLSHIKVYQDIKTAIKKLRPTA